MQTTRTNRLSDLDTDTRNPDNYPKCSRCGRPNDPWPLKRPNTCSPAYWVWCIR